MMADARIDASVAKMIPDEETKAGNREIYLEAVRRLYHDVSG
jgi:hypothetical protein